MAELVTLADCPPGLFIFEGRLFLKTEYKVEVPPGSGEWWPEAYCADSGEFFAGGAQGHESRARLMVMPLEMDAGVAASILMAANTEEISNG